MIDVGGVGYLVLCSTRTLAALPPPGRGDRSPDRDPGARGEHHALRLRERAERGWFRLLQTVQGVGARVALALLSIALPRRAGARGRAEDKAALARANGVGPRLAARIVAELRDRLDRPAASPLHGAATLPVAAGTLDEALSALVNLGYGRSEAHAALARAAAGLGEQPAFEPLVRAALQEAPPASNSPAPRPDRQVVG